MDLIIAIYFLILNHWKSPVKCNDSKQYGWHSGSVKIIPMFLSLDHFKSILYTSPSLYISRDRLVYMRRCFQYNMIGNSTKVYKYMDINNNLYTKFLIIVILIISFTGCAGNQPNIQNDRQPLVGNPVKQGSGLEDSTTVEENTAQLRMNESSGTMFSTLFLPENAFLQKDTESIKPSAQEMLDSALEFCQASSDFWEQGDLDNTIDALDQAYSLILKIDPSISSPEILQQREDLRYTISKRIIEVYSSRFTVANGTYKEIPLIMNNHVEKALDILKGRERDFFLDAYKRSGIYRPAIVEALKKAGLPEELSWLPIIESGFKVRALSPARALGLWQFIVSTGYKFGLKRDQWVDERMDPEKSTQSAIAYLKELHRIFWGLDNCSGGI